MQDNSWILTSKLYVWNNNFLTDIGEGRRIFKQTFIGRSLGNWGQKLDGIAYQLKITTHTARCDQVIPNIN